LQQAQFHVPAGCALDNSGNYLYLADMQNGKVRRLDLGGNRTRTLISGLNQPVALVMDRTNNLYIANQGDGSVIKYDRYGLLTSVATNLASPTAIALDANTNLYVTELVGTVKRINPTNGLVTPVVVGLNQPRGIAVLNSGLLAVSDTGNHSLRIINPANNATVLQIGNNLPGFRDGPYAFVPVQFNQPHQLATAPNGALVVSDYGNHCVRVVTTDGIVATLYGIDPIDWGYDNPTQFLGWWDGSSEFAEAREPFGVTVATNGTVFTTEVYYHLVREIAGSDLTRDGDGGEGAGNLVVNAPIINPNAGYFPMGQTITVTNPNNSLFFATGVYYTTDSSEPTTNSSPVLLTNNAGVIYWRETTRDLTSLRVKAFLGNSPSPTVQGEPVATNQIGITRDVLAGIGATLVIPIVVNLRPKDMLRSLQFRVEITPDTPTTPPITNLFRALSVTNEPFVPVRGPAEVGKIASFSTASYLTNNSRGLVISFIGTNSNLSVENYAAVALLAAPIPTTTTAGDRYRIAVEQPSGTSDGLQTAIDLVPLPHCFIRVANPLYTVGDCAPGTWYNAGDFGNGYLGNNDVNIVFYASLGERAPFLFTDVFDAMDAFPIDATGAPGGDGQIRFLDWQITLYRSLRLIPQSWTRSWGPGGLRVVAPQNIASVMGARASASFPALSATAIATSTGGGVWLRQATIGALAVENVKPDDVVDIPVYVRVVTGYSLAGLQFRATLSPEADAPSLNLPMQFVPAPGRPVPSQQSQIALNDLLLGWSLPSFNPPLQASNSLGFVRFTVPVTARSGQSYTLRFAYADGAPDLSTQYNIETIPGSVWIGTAALKPPELVSDEWKVHFFGSLTNALAQAEADPDGDRVPNWAEYQASANPIQLRLHLLTEHWTAKTTNLPLRWFGELGRRYIVEHTSDLRRWTNLSPVLDGSGGWLEFSDPQKTAPAHFYRVRLLPIIPPNPPVP
jgi:sugar lactone lactonase YvrE